MSIRFSNYSDIPKLRQIMKIVFGDNDLYLDHFFHYKYKNNALIYELNEEIAGIAFILDTIMNNEPISYVYGCATLPEYRGKGIMTEILSFAYQNKCAQNFSALCLVPASDHLFKYYRKLGFRDYFYHKKTSYSLSDFSSLKVSGFSLRPLSPSQYFTLKNQDFYLNNSLIWDVKHYELVEKEYIVEKGGFFEIIENQKRIGIGFFYTHHFKTHIPELLTKIETYKVANLFFNTFETNEIEIITPEKMDCYGMIKWNENLNPNFQSTGFLSFALD